MLCDLFWSSRADTSTSHYPPVWLLSLPILCFHLLPVEHLGTHWLKSSWTLLFYFSFSASSSFCQLWQAFSGWEVEAGAWEKAMGTVMECRGGVRAFRHKQPPENHTDICRRGGQEDDQGCQVTNEKQKKIRFFLVWDLGRSLGCSNS